MSDTELDSPPRLCLCQQTGRRTAPPLSDLGHREALQAAQVSRLQRRHDSAQAQTYLELASQLGVLVNIDSHKVVVGPLGRQSLEDGREDAAGLAPAEC